MKEPKKEEHQKRWMSLLKARDSFLEKFPTELCHVRALCEKAGSPYVDKDNPIGFICGRCKSTSVKLSENHRILKCFTCKDKVSLTADTYFRGIKSPKAWNMIIEFLHMGIVMNSKEFSKLAEIEESSAWTIQLKIATTLSCLVDQESDKISSLSFKEAITKRSLKSTPDQLPSEELEDFAKSIEVELGPEVDDNCEPEETKKSPIDFNTDVNLSDTEKQVLALLEKEPKSIDQLCEKSDLSVSVLSAALTILEINGLISNIMNFRFYLKEETPDRPQFKNKKNSAQTLPIEDADESYAISRCVGEFLKKKFYGISRKYLQLYLVLYEFIEVNAILERTQLSSIFKMSRATNLEQLRAYESPVIIFYPNISTVA